MTFAPEKLEHAIARVAALPDASSREAAREALAVVLEFHRYGLKRLLDALRETTRAGGGDLVQNAARDEVVASLLSLHDLHPSVRPDVPLERLTGARGVGHDRCELCGQPLSTEHEHLFDVERRHLKCACTACGLLFEARAPALRRVRRAARKLEELRISEAQWSALEIPVGLVFLSYSSALGQVIAAYPGPAGAIESTVPARAWEAIVSENSVLAGIEPDTAALLVNRLTPKPTYHILSIDECYRLAGLVRTRWEGLTGGGGPLRAVVELLEHLPEAGS